MEFTVVDAANQHRQGAYLKLLLPWTKVDPSRRTKYVARLGNGAGIVASALWRINEQAPHKAHH